MNHVVSGRQEVLSDGRPSSVRAVFFCLLQGWCGQTCRLVALRVFLLSWPRPRSHGPFHAQARYSARVDRRPLIASCSTVICRPNITRVGWRHLSQRP